MGSGSSRSRVAAYETLPADSDAYAHPADSFEAQASSTAQSTGSSRKRPVSNSAASQGSQHSGTESTDAVRVLAGGRRPKPKEDASAEQASLPRDVSSTGDTLQVPTPKKLPRTFKQGAPAPQMLASQQDAQNLALPQPQPLHQRHIPVTRQVQQDTEEPVPLHLRQAAEEKWNRVEDRATQEDAALAAIRAALPKPKARPTASLESAAAKAAAKEGSDPLAQIASMQAGRAAGKQAKNRYPNVDVSISHRKVLLHWVKIARKRVVAMQSQIPHQRRKPKKSKPVRVDKLVELYLENEENLELMCFQEPKSLILTQIELLTRRIDELDDEVDKERLRREAEMIGRKPGGSGGGDPGISQAKAATDAKRESIEKLGAKQEFWDWETAFDSAVANREAWKKNRGDREREAQANWRNKVAASWPAPMKADEAQKRGKAEVAQQMKLERDRLQALLAKFDAQKRRERFREEQPVLDQVEALQQEQRVAMAERAQELREQREREAAEKKRRQEEAAERRRQAEEERRRAEEERRRAEEEAKEQELRRRLREEEDRRRREREAEEAERKRREEEERELERLRREKKESERKRAEERRLAEEREAQRRREIEERRRQEEERLAGERRKREEDEERQRQKEADELRLAEHERRRQEEERRRVEEEEREMALSRAALRESAFDVLEDAVDDDDEAENEEDAGEEAWQAALGSLEEAPAAAFHAEAEEEEPDEPESSPASPSGADWMSRALGALNDGDDSDGSDEDEEVEGESKNPDQRSDNEKLAADEKFLKLAGAITKKIDQIHGE